MDFSQIQKEIINEEKIIQETVDYMKNRLMSESSGHDWWHVYRVWKMAAKIAKEEKANMFVVQLASLLHDIADWKFHGGDILIGPKIASQFLNEKLVDQKIIDQVFIIIENISFKGARTKEKELSLEGQIVQDADRLDAIGAIGIARTFAYGGFTKQELYNPEMSPTLHKTFEEYKNSKTTTINHFYEKLLLLKDRMNTQTAKNIAVKRHAYMENFLIEFFEEQE